MPADVSGRSGRNKDGYLGQTIQVDRELTRLKNQSIPLGWMTESLPTGHDDSLMFMHRSAVSPAAPSILITAGIHGDEPATTVSLCQLILEDALPRNITYAVFPCLNPRGMRISRRETPEGVDLNRDFLEAETKEVRTELKKLREFESFDVAILLHEDWEANGFYLYELTQPNKPPRFGRSVLDAVSKVCPIEKNALVEGHEADRGLIHPPYHQEQRQDWPEAFYMMHNKTDHSLTLEAPSDFDMQVRMKALMRAVLTTADLVSGEEISIVGTDP